MPPKFDINETEWLRDGAELADLRNPLLPLHLPKHDNGIYDDGVYDMYKVKRQKLDGKKKEMKVKIALKLGQLSISIIILS